MIKPVVQGGIRISTIEVAGGCRNSGERKRDTDGQTKCHSACNIDPLMEWAPRGGRVGFQQLTARPGFQRMKAHGKASNPQRRVQTAGVTGVSERRGPSRAPEAAQCLPHPEPSL